MMKFLIIAVSVMNLYAISYSISSHTLNENVEKKFPIEKKLLMSTFVFSNPKISIDKKEDIIHFECEAFNKALVSGTGEPLVLKVYASSNIIYKNGDVYLKNIKVKNIQNQYISQKLEKKLIFTSQTILNLYFANKPIYSISKSNYAMKLTLNLIDDIVIDNGELKIILN